jgi:ParB family chromosome partitioning protein
LAKRGLGKGLDALIGSAAKEGHRLEQLAVKDIRPNPRQPRRIMDEESLEEMVRSIQEFGIVQPVVVRTVGTEYELIAGERRWRAALKAGLERIPAVVKESTETSSLEIALIENLHREDLNGIEEAIAYRQLLEDFGITHEELSTRVGKSRVAITNTVRLLQLPHSIQKEVMEGNLSTGHAKALLGLNDRPREQEKLCSRIVKKGLSVRQAEELAGELKEGSTAGPVREKTPLPEEARQIFLALEERLDTRVRGSMGKRKGKIVIEFRDLEDLKRIIGVVGGDYALAGDSSPGDSSSGRAVDTQ